MDVFGCLYPALKRLAIVFHPYGISKWPAAFMTDESAAAESAAFVGIACGDLLIVLRLFAIKALFLSEQCLK